MRANMVRSVSFLVLLFGALAGGTRQAAADIMCDGDPTMLTARQPLSIKVVVPMPDPATLPSGTPINLGFDGCLRYHPSNPVVMSYTGQVTLIFLDDQGRFVGAAGQQLVVQGQDANAGQPIPVVPAAYAANDGHTFGASFAVDYPLDYKHLATSALVEVSITDCTPGPGGPACGSATAGYLWSTPYLTRTGKPATTAGSPPAVTCGTIAPDDGKRKGVIPAGAFMRVIQNTDGTTTIRLIGCLRFADPAQTYPYLGGGAVGAVYVGRDGSLLAQSGAQPRALGQAVSIFAGTIAPDQVGGTAPPLGSTEGLHVYGFDYVFPGIAVENVAPDVALVVTLRSCSNNDMANCSGTPVTWVQSIRPCFIGRSPEADEYRGQCPPKPKP